MGRILALVSLFAFSFLAFAQDVVLPPPVSNNDFLLFAWQAIGGAWGAGSLAIAGAVVQVLMKFVVTPFFDGMKIAGKYKFLAVAVLTYMSAVIALMAGPAKLSLVNALFDGSVLLPLMVMVHQIIKQFKEEPKVA